MESQENEVKAHLLRSLETAETIKVDYDLEVLNYLQQTSNLNHMIVTDSVNQIFAEFAIEGPKTSLQDDLNTCALHILQTIENYNTKTSNNERCSLPFDLRFQTLESLACLGDQPVKKLSDTHAVILLDVCDRLIALGLPPNQIAGCCADSS